MSCAIFLGLGCTGLPYATGYTNLIFALLTFLSSLLFTNCRNVNGKLFGPEPPLPPPKSLDAFVANNNKANRVYINDGMNPVGFTASDASSEANFSRSVALGDLDGDGDLDAFVVNNSNSQANFVYINDGINPVDFTTNPASLAENEC